MSKFWKMPYLTLLACQACPLAPEQMWNNSLCIQLLLKNRVQLCIWSGGVLFLGTSLPAPYLRQLWVAQGLHFRIGVRECSPTASTVSENHAKPFPVLIWGEEHTNSATVHIFSCNLHSLQKLCMNGAYENSCCQLTTLVIQHAKMACCITFHTCVIGSPSLHQWQGKPLLLSHKINRK